METENKAVLISIQPKWCELILREKKTIEVRKTRPKLETPFKCYIYQTKGKEKLIDIMKDGDNCYGETYHGKPVFIKMRENSGYAGLFGREQKVIGEFMCDKIETLPPNTVFNAPALYSQSCLTREEFFEYAADDTVYFWHISDPKIYDEPRKLSEFANSSSRLRFSDTKDGFPLQWSGLQKPPQSWCYVEEVESL